MKNQTWGPGEWDNEPDEDRFESHGYQCMMIRSSMGVWLGYVGLPASHPWHGKNYNDVNVAVHGGLTYSGKRGEKEFPGLWFLGFDCGHYGDHVPELAVHSRRAGHGHYRSHIYAKLEVESLAEQLRGIEDEQKQD